MRSVLCRAHRNVAVQIAAHDGEIAVVILGSVVVNIAELIGVLCSGSILMFAERNIEEILMFPCVNYPRVFTYLNRSSTF